MRGALLLGSSSTVAAWQFGALETAIQSGLEITTVLHCTNDRRPPLSLSHAAYYALALSGRRRMSMLRNTDVTSLLPKDVKTIRFPSEWEGGWQRLPTEVAAELGDVDVVIKFGMDLLTDPEQISSTYGVVSYHHGDPGMHRGRPSGFYELTAGESTIGVVVHQLNNSWDGNVVLAKGHSRVIPTSYRRTLNDAYAIGAPLLAKALETLGAGRSRPAEKLGTQHQLPVNKQVAGAVARMAFSRVGRIIYGALREKRWNIAYVSQEFDPERPRVPKHTELQPIPLPKGYTFAADPAGESRGRLFCEVMHAGTGKGQIFAVEGESWHRVDLPVNGGHLSYPQIVAHAGSTYLFPEMAEVGAPTLFELDQDHLTCTSVRPLVGLEHERLVDGTLVPHEEHWYLFASRPQSSGTRLELWVADDLMGPWTPHPNSPVCLDPRNARMAGPVLRARDRMYRLGQDGAAGYGQGITINRIDELAPRQYAETRLAPLRINGAFGPHTVLATEKGYWLDYYTENWAPLAGVRRFKGLFR